jgi:hypothetical protein
MANVNGVANLYESLTKTGFLLTHLSGAIRPPFDLSDRHQLRRLGNRCGDLAKVLRQKDPVTINVSKLSKAQTKVDGARAMLELIFSSIFNGFDKADVLQAIDDAVISLQGL